MSDALQPVIPHIPAFLLVMFRLTGIFVFAPVFASSAVPRTARVMLAFSLTFAIYPITPAHELVQMNVMSMIWMILSEMMVGIVIGYVISLPLMAIQVGMQLMGQQLGLAFANIVDPDTGGQTSVFTQAMYLFALTIFIILDGHHATIGALIRSFDSVPLGGFVPDGELLIVLTGLLTVMFELAIRVAAPLLCLLFLQTTAMGFVAKTVPQLNILSLGFPLRIMLGFGLTIGVVAMLSEAFMEVMRYAISAVFDMFTP